MKRFIAGLLMSGLMIPQLGAIVPPSCFNDSHDITSLTSWGPYSKRYAGISHIPDIKKGIRFDFSVMPGYYRNRQLVPHVLFESSYYPWNINPSMNRITYRYELEWKDRVFTDVTYYILDESSTLVGIRCVNNTETYQNLALNQMAYIDYRDGNTQLPLTVEEGHIFVMGDNRNGSLDSRCATIGQIDVKDVFGKAIFRIWPLDRFGSIEPDYTY